MHILLDSKALMLVYYIYSYSYALTYILTIKMYERTLVLRRNIYHTMTKMEHKKIFNIFTNRIPGSKTKKIFKKKRSSFVKYNKFLASLQLFLVLSTIYFTYHMYLGFEDMVSYMGTSSQNQQTHHLFHDNNPRLLLW